MISTLSPSFKWLPAVLASCAISTAVYAQGGIVIEGRGDPSQQKMEALQKELKNREREVASAKAEAEAQRQRADAAVKQAAEKPKPVPAPPVPQPPRIAPAELQAAQREAQQERARREQAERSVGEASERARLAEANERIAQLVRELAALQARTPVAKSAPVVVPPTPPAPVVAAPAAPATGQIDKPCNECPELLVISPGNFVMGSPASEKGDSDEQPQRRITIRHTFAVGKYESTQAEWRAIMGSSPSHFKGCDSCPVENVSWNDTQDFLKRLNAKTNQRYRLLTEAEWEYAARAGSTTRYSFGDSEATLGNFAWFTGNSGSRTHPVGEKSPNAWGLYDMHGNVWEWVQDCFVNPYPQTPTDGTAVTGGAACNRVLRGGSWGIYARLVRAAVRDNSSRRISATSTSVSV